MHVWQADLVKDEIIEHIPEGGCDLLLIMFVLSVRLRGCHMQHRAG